MPKRNEQERREKTLQGIISVTSKGTGYVELSGFDEDIEVAGADLNTALNGDTVEVALLPGRGPRRQGGRVLRVLTRSKTRFVGTLKREETGFILVSDDRRLYRHIRIPAREHDRHPLTEGEKALVEMLAWKDPARDPEGRVLRTLGTAGEHHTEMAAIVLARGFDLTFPEAVLKEAEALHATAASRIADEGEKRRDFRNVPTFTIDPDDAKDFDDAISVQTTPEGTEVGIHIADVTAYLTPGGAIDREAQARGTSIYLVDRTIPMLPEVLSNDLCSLRPDEDRLAFSAVFTLDEKAGVIARWFGTTIIRSAKRFTYEDAQKVIETGTGPYASEIGQAWKLAKELTKRRMSEGAIDFDDVEVKFILDEAGKPIGVKKKERKDANRLIEEFMLLANREVASFVAKRSEQGSVLDRLFIYRIHDVPNREKIEDLSVFLKAIGYDLETNKGAVTGHAINKLLKKIEGKPEASLIRVATLRSMAKAIYATKNIGHFGLSFKHYTHFTSPIRRYPDVMVHRILKRHLGGSPIPAEELSKYERLSIQCSQREAEAVSAERDSVKYKQVEYLVPRVGEVFEGTVSGVTEWGFYVEEKETRAEGLVRMRSIGGDYYTLDQKRYRIVGERTKKAYSLGDPIRVKLVAADLATRTLDFALA